MTATVICPDGPDPRLHRYAPGVYDPSVCLDCGHEHTFRPLTGAGTVLGRFVDPEECRDLGALLGAALMGATR